MLIGLLVYVEMGVILVYRPIATIMNKCAVANYIYSHIFTTTAGSPNAIQILRHLSQW